MEYHALGLTGLNVSVLCLGTMQFGWTADESTALKSVLHPRWPPRNTLPQITRRHYEPGSGFCGPIWRVNPAGYPVTGSRRWMYHNP